MIRAFWLGVREFRQAFTTRVPPAYELDYEWGREFMHCLTFRRFES